MRKIACFFALVVINSMPFFAEPISVNNDTVKVIANSQDGHWSLQFSVKRTDGSWRLILSTAAAATDAPWEPKRRQVSEDPQITWSRNGRLEEAEFFFTKAEILDSRTLVLRGNAAGELIEERVTLEKPNRVHVHMCSATTTPIELNQFMSHFYLTPDGRAFGYALPLDLAWLPVLHWKSEDLASDHFFRSPVVLAMAQGSYAGLVPDLTLIRRNRLVPYALDLRVIGTKAEAARLSYGLSTSEVVPHTFARHRANETATIPGTDLNYVFDVLLGEATEPGDVIERMTSYLWDVYGHRFFQDIRPQALPFEEYGRRYAYVHELMQWATPLEVDGKTAYGLNNQGRRGSNFHAWENDLHVAYGLTYYANKWHDGSLAKIGEGILRLIESAPRKDGAFPTIFNFNARKWEGSLFWTARSADAINGYDAAAMGVTAWWELYWYENLKQDPEILKSVVSYARLLAHEQLASGAIPTYFDSNLEPAPQLKEAGTTALSGAVLAKAALLSGDEELRDAAIRSGVFVEQNLLPELKFQDFESFYSCSPTPIQWRDPWTGIWPQNTLSVEWAADEFLALYRLTGDRIWLNRGEQALGNLSLYQQVWAPPYYSIYLYGGFGVMNTDGEWNDGRQGRFVSTYADYYIATRNREYLERAVASARAGFALMDISENHANGINQLSVMPPGLKREQGAGLGYAPENVYHGGPASDTGWSGFDWSAGGALSAAAYLEQKFGGVWVDFKTRDVVPIDGTAATLVASDDGRIALKISNALDSLQAPFTTPRDVLIKFGDLDRPSYEVVINGTQFQIKTRHELERGLVFHLE